MGKPIEKLTIKGYKSIRALEDFPLTNLNVLIGANGAGKTNFVSFFKMLRELVNQNLQLHIREKGGADAHLYLGSKVTKSIDANLDFPPNRYSFRLGPTVQNELVFLTEVTQYLDTSPHLLGHGHAEAVLKKRISRAGFTGGHSIEWYVFQSVTNWEVYHFHDTSESAPVRRTGSIRDNERLRPNAENLAAYLLHLKQSEQAYYDLILATVQSVAPFFDDFLLRPTANGADETVLLEWRQKGSDYPFHPSQLSDGTLRFICLATALLQPRPPATILFDEPELGLHPYALTTLAGLIRKASARTQIIVATQSAALLDEFEPEQVIVVDRVDGASTFNRLNSDALKNWLRDYSLGELWRKNVIAGGPVHE